MSHKKIVQKAEKKLEKDETKYKAKIKTAKKHHDEQKANHYKVELKEVKHGEKDLKKLAKSFKTD